MTPICSPLTLGRRKETDGANDLICLAVAAAITMPKADCGKLARTGRLDSCSYERRASVVACLLRDPAQGRDQNPCV